MDWDKWLDLLQVAIMAKYSISITDLTREASQQNPRVRTLSGDLYEDPAIQKVFSVMYLSLGEVARINPKQVSAYAILGAEGTRIKNIM